MALSTKLRERSSGTCELCSSAVATIEYTVSPKNDDSSDNQVAICETCKSKIDDAIAANYWRCLEGAIWNPQPSVQALSYRILYGIKENEGWANDVITSVDLDENTINWALSAFEVADVHKDAFGNKLENGDTVVLTQMLDVKGTSFSASKGTVVKKIKLVADNHEHIEGKVNDQTIVILTKFVKKSL